ncbi:hypothetical protein [Bacillus wiedmannii]|uniref:hypothetical protein n=1 Tax=Bacillus TaxID=1386 RepID=UPI000B02D8A8
MKQITLQKQQMNLQEQEDNRSWHEKTALYAQSFLHGVIVFFQGAGDAALENFLGLQPHEDDKLESKTTYQAGMLAGNVISIAGSIVEMFEAISLIGGSNFLTIVAEVGTGGLASPIVIPLDIAATATRASLFAHGGFVWDKSIQNTKDTLQKFESPSPHGHVSKVKGTSNTTTVNVSRKGALNKAKSEAGIPKVQHPEKIERVPMRTADHEGGHVIKDSNGKVIYTRRNIILLINMEKNNNSGS